jgi:hypothetical protein
VAFGGEDLDGDVIGAGVEVGVEPGGEIVNGTVQGQGVDQAVAPAVDDVVVAVAVAAQVVGVVAKLEVGVGQERAADPTGDLEIALEDDAGEQRYRAGDSG